MSVDHDNLLAECQAVAKRARSAARLLAQASDAVVNGTLMRAAQAVREERAAIERANAADVQANPGLPTALLDRLTLTPARIEGCAQALEAIAQQPAVVGEVIEQVTRPNGLVLKKLRVPLGVVLFIYESRPNVTTDAAGICLKSGNAVILKGGKEAQHSNALLTQIMRAAARTSGLPEDCVQLLPAAGREYVGHLLGMPEWVDVVIPRGGESLIRRIAAEAKMPVIKHYTGNCHIYVDASADLSLAEKIIVNAKCQRPGVCNAAESLLIDEKIAQQFVPNLGRALAARQVQIRGDATVCRLIPIAIPATDADWATEYLDLIVSIKCVPGVQAAIDHIARYGSAHTDAILAQDQTATDAFVRQVDSAAVVVNASTRFHDGGEFGLGAEIGISTDKFHARGPCGTRELTSTKYIVLGQGQIRT